EFCSFLSRPIDFRTSISRFRALSVDFARHDFCVSFELCEFQGTSSEGEDTADRIRRISLFFERLEMSDFSAWFKSVPFMTRHWLALTVGFTLMGKLGILRFEHMVLLYEPFVHKFQVNLFRNFGSKNPSLGR
ncbi:hypothetical protein GE061_008700, partial [Apolygus lucorum]